MEDPEREQKQTELLLKQEKAKGLIFDNLDTVQFEKVLNCVTVCQVLDKLDSEFKVTSQIGLIAARDDYHSFKFGAKGDMSKFLEIFDVKCQTFINAGGRVDDTEKVHQLSAALPFCYNTVLNWFEQLSPEKQTFDMYRKKVHEKWKRFKHSSDHVDSEKNHKPINDEKNHKVEHKSESKKTYCRYCHAKDHNVTDCDKLRKKKANENSSPSVPVSTQASNKKPETANSSKPKNAIDWTQKKTYKKDIVSMCVNFEEDSHARLQRITLENQFSGFCLC